MPGLVGIISLMSKEQNKRDLLKMVNTLRSESFYSTGTYINDEAGLYLGWACHEGSYCDCMPIMNERKDLVLFFYGEHHADRGLIEELRGRGHAIEKEDAGVLIHLFEEKGPDCLRALNGWFHGVLIDLKKREIFIFNDRYGMQRLYYFDNGRSFLFASQAKAILNARKELRVLDPRGVGEFLACNCVLQDRSLFRNVYRLPGGSVYKFKNAILRSKANYFKPQEWERQTPMTMEGFDRELEGLFPRVMERYLRSSQPIGVSLSGGLDTRQLMAFLDNRRHKVSCYTFDSMYRETHDAGLARRVAEACGQSHQVLKLRRDYLTSFPAICEQAISLSDGGLGAGDSYELYLNRIARGIAPIRLTGSYGSEVFRSLRGFKAARPNERLTHPDYREHIDAAIETFDEFSKGNNLTFCLFQQAPSYGYGRVAVEQSQIVLRTPFMDNDLVGLLYRAPESARATTQTQWRLIKQGNPALAAIPTDRGLKGRSGALASRWAYLSSYFLFKADYLYKSGMPQWMEQLHYLLGPLQPERLVIGQHRFYHFRIWFRNELAPYIKDILLDPLTAQRPYFNGASIEPMVLRHIKGDRNYTEDIEKALTLELIQRLFIDENNENAISAGDH